MSSFPVPRSAAQRPQSILLVVIAALAAWRLASIAWYDYGMFVDEAQYEALRRVGHGQPVQPDAAGETHGMPATAMEQR